MTAASEPEIEAIVGSFRAHYLAEAERNRFRKIYADQGWSKPSREAAEEYLDALLEVLDATAGVIRACSPSGRGVARTPA